MKLLFLDLDGVLNRHVYDDRAQSGGIVKECVDQLNYVLWKTGCYLAISSAWRYIVHGGDMTIRGFEYMLRTHGVHCPGRVLGVTGKDDGDGGATMNMAQRSQQIRDFVALANPANYAVVDDLKIEGHDPYFVQTNPNLGMTKQDADKLVAILGVVPQMEVPW